MGVIQNLIDKARGNEALAETPGVSQPASDVPPATPRGNAAEEVIKKRRGRPPGSGSGSRGTQLSPREAQMAQAFEELYHPKTWEGIVCAPADTMLALSGRKLWEVSTPERETLSTHAALTARCFAVENPKWLALTMLAISIAHIYGARTVQHMHERRKEQEAEAAKAATLAKKE